MVVTLFLFHQSPYKKPNVFGPLDHGSCWFDSTTSVQFLFLMETQLQVLHNQNLKKTQFSALTKGAVNM